MGMLPKFVHKFRRGWNFTIFPSFRVEPQFRFRGRAHSPQFEVHVAPGQKHYLLFPETGQQKRGEQGAFLIRADSKEAGKLFVAGMSGFLLKIEF